LQLFADVSPVVAVKRRRGLAAFKSLGDKEFDGVPREAVKVVDPNPTDLTFFIDKASKLLVGMTFTSSHPDVGVDLSSKITFEGFQTHGGVQFPSKMSNLVAGVMTATCEYSKTEINVELDDDLFEREKEKEKVSATVFELVK
jgi:hypothetical protein